MDRYEFKLKPIGNAAIEAYKTLRTNLMFGSGGEKPNVITVSSSLPGEGKSSTSLFLAISFAQLGQKVLLIDADMRKPGENPANEKGLSYLLEKHLTVEDAICSTNYENLHFLPSGLPTQNPVELFSRDRFSVMLKYLVEDLHYDKVVIDTPSAGSFIDGAVIAAQTDGTLLVAKCGSTDAGSLMRSKQQLESLSVRIIGVVLNVMKKGEYGRCSTYKRYVRYYAKKSKWL